MGTNTSRFLKEMQRALRHSHANRLPAPSGRGVNMRRVVPFGDLQFLSRPYNAHGCLTLETGMAREIETKFIDPDLDAVRRALGAGGGVRKDRYFERNLVFDTPDRRLREKNVLLRLRKAGRCVLTLKRPPREMGPDTDGVRLKVWEETETVVLDFEAMREVLFGLGFVLAFAYEKIRETWELAGCKVCLDTLPFGEFVEIEGEPEAIHGCADLLGLAPEASSDLTYHALNREYRRKAGLGEDENFCFPADDPRRNMADLAFYCISERANKPE